MLHLKPALVPVLVGSPSVSPFVEMLNLEVRDLA
jgi:hypothetical protein